MTFMDGYDELERLGQLVQTRRIERGWKTREQFASSTSFSYRVLTDLENGRRRLGRASYREIEGLLGWGPGSIDRVLEGGEPLEGIVTHDESPALSARSSRESAPADRMLSVPGRQLLAVSGHIRDAEIALDAEQIQQAKQSIRQARSLISMIYVDAINGRKTPDPHKNDRAHQRNDGLGKAKIEGKRPWEVHERIGKESPDDPDDGIYLGDWD